MKLKNLLFGMFFTLALYSSAQERTSFKATSQDVTTSQASNLMQTNTENPNFVILDVRTKTEYDEGHIKNAVQMDFYASTFDADLNQLNKSKTYLVYCKSGNRSSQTLTKMQTMNFTATLYNMLGGITQWNLDALPVASPTSLVGADITTSVANNMIKQHSQDANFVLLDVRTPSEFQAEYIAGAVNLDFNSSTFDSNLAQLDKNRQYLVYCNTGNRSRQAVDKMLNLNFIESYNMLGGITKWKTDGYPTITPTAYCAAKGNNVQYEWIAKVQIGNFTNTTGAGSGYSDFTSQTINLSAGSSNNTILTPGFSGTSYMEYWKVYVDFNKDGDFSDAGEELFSKNSNAAVSGSISIPSSVSGYYRLRIIMKYNAVPTPCEAFSYGEVEDYTLNVVSDQDTQAPTAPTSLAASNIAESSAQLSWMASTDNVGVTAYDVYFNNSVIGSTATLSFLAKGLSPNANYTVFVKAKDAAGNVSAASNTVTVHTNDTTGGCIASYPYNESFESGLGGFTQETTDNIDWTRKSGTTPSSGTGPSGASDGTYYMYVEASSPNYPSKVANLLSPCFNFTTLRTPKIDFKYHMYGVNMGKLDVQVKTNSASWTTIFTITGDQGNSWKEASVDLRQYAGQPFMQFRFIGTTGNNYASDICIDLVNIECSGVTNDTIPPSAPTNLVASNVTSSSFVLNWDESTDNIGVTGYDVYKDNVLLTTVTTNTYAVTDLSPLVVYEFYVKAKDAVGNESVPSNMVIQKTTEAVYCASLGNSQQYEWIAGVQVGGFNVQSGALPYTDFTDSLTIRVTPGFYSPVVFTPGFSGSAYNEYWTIWVDYNLDGDFDDAGEKIYTKNSKTSISDSIIFVPAGTTGVFRARIIMSYSQNTPSCGTFEYGETEDYTIWCGCGSAPEQTILSNIEYSIYPNPASTFVNMLINSDTDSKTEVKLYSIAGKLVYSESVETFKGAISKRIDFGNIPKGLYIITVTDGKELKSKKLMVQ